MQILKTVQFLKKKVLFKGEKKMKNNIEYKMPEQMAKDYYKKRGDNNAKMTMNEYLCKVVNEEYGLKGKCTKVILF